MILEHLRREHTCSPARRFVSPARILSAEPMPTKVAYVKNVIQPLLIPAIGGRVRPGRSGRGSQAQEAVTPNL